MNNTQQYFYLVSKLECFKKWYVSEFRENMGKTGIFLGILGTITATTPSQILGMILIVGAILRDEIREK